MKHGCYYRWGEIAPLVIKCVSSLSFICSVHYCNGSSINSWDNLSSRGLLNLKASNSGPHPVLLSAYVVPRPGWACHRRIMFYENNDYNFSIIVSLIVLPANNVTTTKTTCSILTADLAKGVKKKQKSKNKNKQPEKAHYLLECQDWHDNRLVSTETIRFAFVGPVLSSQSQAKRKGRTFLLGGGGFINRIFHLCFQKTVSWQRAAHGKENPH